MDSKNQDKEAAMRMRASREARYRELVRRSVDLVTLHERELRRGNARRIRAVERAIMKNDRLLNRMEQEEAGPPRVGEPARK